MKDQKDIQSAFSMMMSKKNPDAQAFEDDFNQLSKQVGILGQYVPMKNNVSPFMAEKMNEVLDGVHLMVTMCKEQSNYE
jgi:hypothetical protein|tara:strand:- start:419 stop:655 length:237 start_codon:yes stop_codon:yes gene_type:complete